jgi:chromosome partitioning protein
MKTMISIAIANQKGGVGKTTTTAALGAALCDQGLRVLMVDMDSQASLTKALVINAVSQSVADVLGGSNEGTLTLNDVIQPLRDGLSLAPSNILMYTTEMGLVSRMGRESILKKALDNISDYDIALIDCPPSLGMLTINGLVASQSVIVPSLPAESDLQGVRAIMETINGIEAAGLNGQIKLLGILIIQFDGRTNEHNRILEGIKSNGYPLLGVIPRSVKAQESIAAKRPVTEYAPKSKPSQAYLEVAEKLVTWIEENVRQPA